MKFESKFNYGFYIVLCKKQYFSFWDLKTFTEKIKHSETLRFSMKKLTFLQSLTVLAVIVSLYVNKIKKTAILFILYCETLLSNQAKRI